MEERPLHNSNLIGTGSTGMTKALRRLNVLFLKTVSSVTTIKVSESKLYKRYPDWSKFLNGIRIGQIFEMVSGSVKNQKHLWLCFCTVQTPPNCRQFSRCTA